MARIHWVALEDWNALPSAELISLLKDARDRTYQKLPQRTKDLLALPAKELGKLVAERRKVLAARADVEKATKESRAASNAGGKRRALPARKKKA